MQGPGLHSNQPELIRLETNEVWNAALQLLKERRRLSKQQVHSLRSGNKVSADTIQPQCRALPLPKLWERQITHCRYLFLRPGPGRRVRVRTHCREAVKTSRSQPGFSCRRTSSSQSEKNCFLCPRSLTQVSLGLRVPTTASVSTPSQNRRQELRSHFMCPGGRQARHACTLACMCTQVHV